MTWEAWFTLAVAGVVLVAMVRYQNAPDLVMLAGIVMLATVGVVKPEDAFKGFANEAMLTVAALFVVAAGLRETGALDMLGGKLLGKATTARQAMIRLGLSVNFMSAFMNNTPIVAMMIPVVSSWCRRNRVAPSRLMIPLSHFTVLGGMCTLIGTSTNLVVNGLMIQAQSSATDDRIRTALRPFGLFEISYVGIPCAIIGTLFIMAVAKKLLPDRKDLLEQISESPREFLVHMVVQKGCRLVGQSVEAAGLRRLPGLFLVEIGRNGTQTIAPVSPDDVFKEGDTLTFSGVVSSIVDLEKIPGLVPASEDYELRAAERRKLRLCEAVISPKSPLVGKTVREAEFRAVYNSAVVAVHRGGDRLRGRIGDIKLQPGDTLLLQAGTNFVRAHRNDSNFILVSGVEGSRPMRHDRAPLSLFLLVALVALMTTGVVSVVMAAFIIAVLMVATRAISPQDARASVDWQTLIGIAAAFGMGKALEQSGAAGATASAIVGAVGPWGPGAVLAVVYLLTMIFTEVLSNNAAAALMFPFATAAAAHMDVSPRPFCIVVMFAASLAFATPFGYQTSLMVYGPGGYKFSDYMKIGIPLNIIMWIVAALLIPVFWPFDQW